MSWPLPGPTAVAVFPGGSDLGTQAYLILLSFALLCFTDVVFLKADPWPMKRLQLALLQYSLDFSGLEPNLPVSVSSLSIGTVKEVIQISGFLCLLRDCRCLLDPGSMF